MSVGYAVAKTKETGYALLELSLHDAANLDVAARCRLTDAGLRIVCSRGALYSTLGKYHQSLSVAGRRNVVAVFGRLAQQPVAAA